MDVLATTIGSIVSCVCTDINTSVAEKCKYLNNPTKEIEILRNKKSELIARMEDAKTRLQIVEEQGKTPTAEVQNWLNNANVFVASIDGLEEKSKEARRFVYGVFPNCTSQLKLGQHISKLIIEVNELLEKGSQFSDESLSLLLPKKGTKLPTTSLVGKTTTQKNVEMVWECLMDDETTTIGLYGMGGVGKTTIVKEINNRLLEQKHRFDKVIWVTVSKDATGSKLQDDIAKTLNNLTLPNTGDETERSALLLQALEQKKRFALFLDDMWESFSLVRIGIPEFNEHNGNKLVLTTRSLEVCKRMGCKKHIKIEPLSEDEAWKLFYKTVDVRLDPQVEQIAKKVAMECSCLPLAIITVGEVMRGTDDIREWRVALTDLRNSNNCSLKMEEQVIERLKFSYNRLGDDIYKSCFLYYALWPEDYNIRQEDLIELWVMEGLIIGKSIEDEFDRGHVVLNKLKSCCLLEYGKNNFGFEWETMHDDQTRDMALHITKEMKDFGFECVKMHDLIRDMALHITKEMNPWIIVKSGVRPEEFPDEQAWGEDAERASFIGSGIKEILISPNCPRLTTLLLNGCSSLKYITNGFFVQMRGLRVLNLSGSRIELLPESIANLVNLEVLDLSWCRYLRRVPSVEKLQSLRVLRLDSTSMEELPRGMEALINLKRLHIIHIDHLNKIPVLREIPAFLIQKFCLLQDLVAPYFQVNMEELLSLSHLESLAISFKSLSDFCYYLQSDKFKGLDYFSITVGEGRFFFGLRRSRSVWIFKDSAHRIPDNALLLPQNTENLVIISFNELTRLSDLACLKDVRELRTCEINSCSELEYLLSSDENCHLLLQHLEKLKIKSCHKLITLCNGVVTDGTTFSCLKELEIWNCNKFKYLFSSKMFKQLRNLVKVYIRGCHELEDVIIASEEEEEGTNTASTSLKIVYLGDMKKLKTLFSRRMLQYLQNLEEVKIEKCCKIEELIVEEEEEMGSNNKTILLPRLNKLTLKHLPELNSIWKGEMVCASLQTVKVFECDKLKKLPRFCGEDRSPPSALKEIKGSTEWWNTLEWHAPFARNLFQPLFHEYE